METRQLEGRGTKGPGPLGPAKKENDGMRAVDVHQAPVTRGLRKAHADIGVRKSFDMQTRTKAGRPVWINISILVTANGHGRPLTIHLFHDVTATKEMLDLVAERFSAPAPSP